MVFEVLVFEVVNEVFYKFYLRGYSQIVRIEWGDSGDDGAAAWTASLSSRDDPFFDTRELEHVLAVLELNWILHRFIEADA
jgi:hypothetical protein